MRATSPEPCSFPRTREPRLCREGTAALGPRFRGDERWKWLRLLRQQRRPGRIGGEARRRLLLLVPAGDVDRIEIRPGAEIAEIHDDAAVRREGRAFVVEALGQNALAGAVRLEDADRELAVGLAGEGDVVAARR